MFTLKKAKSGEDFNILRFIIPYIAGVAMSFAGTFFMMGFSGQMKHMFDKKRRITTIILLVAIALTLVVAILFKNVLLVFICLAVQFCALFWYVVILVPGLRALICFCCKQAFKEEE